jgi:hypothetical protein
MMTMRKEVERLPALLVNIFITLSKRAVEGSLEVAKSILKFFHSFTEIKIFKQSQT